MASVEVAAKSGRAAKERQTSSLPMDRARVGAAGTEAARWSHPIGAPTSAARAHLAAELSAAGGFLELFILRASDGLIVVSTEQEQKGKYRESSPYFVGGLLRDGIGPG